MESKLKKVKNWLRKEAEQIEEEIFRIEVKRKKIIENTDMKSLNKMNQFNIEIRELRATQNKLYELIGRSDRELTDGVREDKNFENFMMRVLKNRFNNISKVEYNEIENVKQEIVITTLDEREMKIETGFDQRDMEVLQECGDYLNEFLEMVQGKIN